MAIAKRREEASVMGKSICALVMATALLLSGTNYAGAEGEEPVRMMGLIESVDVRADVLHLRGNVVLELTSRSEVRDWDGEKVGLTEFANRLQDPLYQESGATPLVSYSVEESFGSLYIIELNLIKPEGG